MSPEEETAMAQLATDWASQITIDPAIQGGKPVIAGTRMPVHIILGSLAGGMSIEEVCEDYYLTDDQVRAAIGYAAQTVADEAVVVSR
jgi:uncharacterized protein (DUF433 family)